MANQEHLDILKQGVEVWNRWKQKHLDIAPDFIGSSLYDTNFTGANLSRAEIGWTIFGKVDLSTVKGLNTVKHIGPSTIGIDTIYDSQGNIPEVFLQGAGIDNIFIAYIRSLVNNPIDYYTCFISYSSKDQAFA